jgi:hypothetical protein
LERRRATSDKFAQAQAARELAAPYAKSIDQWQSRLAQIDAMIQWSHNTRDRTAALIDEAQIIELEVTERLRMLDAAIWQAPMGVGLHSRVGDVRNALLSIRIRTASLRNGAVLGLPRAGRGRPIGEEDTYA